MKIKHTQKLANIKQNGKYYNREIDQWQKVSYYLDKVDLEKPTYQELHLLLSATFKHAKRRQNFFTSVDRHPDFTLRCVYSNQILSDQKGDILEKCNEQHSFPQSFQRGSKAGTGRDMHAIFAAHSSVNGSRGNIPFGDVGELLKEDNYGKIYCHNKTKYYCPNINKGALARASLYILVCFKNCANYKYLPKESVDWMIKQTLSNPVTEWERHRNQQLYLLQGNRNPFIDYPQLAAKIDFEEGWQK